MTIVAPTISDVIVAGEKLGVQMTERDAAEYLQCMEGLVASYRIVDSMPDYLPVEPVVDSRVGPYSAGTVAPASARTQHVHDAAYHPPVVLVAMPALKRQSAAQEHDVHRRHYSALREYRHADAPDHAFIDAVEIVQVGQRIAARPGFGQEPSRLLGIPRLGVERVAGSLENAENPISAASAISVIPARSLP